ncbi:Vitamin B12-binding protein precursor [Sporomusa ovata DSM 2662]|uniref:Iron(III) ABC transporter, solute-binding protein n=1 Tax=Sporomusa ovata TaxID=2378 RepID=A0A0U1L172_9FIRM|nr:ABC transporter substrate-binding protein [Sporomusa ovata]EQB27573.1 ABC-type Fe3+-hydroxamate transport system, periplasmic component [Sporomusa ovata DSM 2662]CQR73426.1 Iron(III) ABC transporter, solute-binding protein [Sporomusa ovata]
MKKCVILVGFGLLLLLVAVYSKTMEVSQNTQNLDIQTITVTDQLGRQVRVPRDIQRISAMNTHIGAYIVYALGQQDKLVGNVFLGSRLNQAMDSKEKNKMSGNGMERNHTANIETLLALKPQVIFCEVALDGSALRQFEDAGLTVVAIKGETIEESFAAVRLMAKVLDCDDKGEEYINACVKLLGMVENRVGDVPADKRPNILYLEGGANLTVASGDMLQTHMLKAAGAENVAADLKARWPMVSPERIIQWNPDVIILGPAAGASGTSAIFDNTKFSTLKAVEQRQVYAFPSNIGWWDFPAPHCVLGIVWIAKTIYPDKFADIDMTALADDFYRRFMGQSFTEMGGKL